MIYGAARCGISIPLEDLSLPMLTDLLEYEMKITSGDKTVAAGEPKSLSEIIKGGKL